MSSGIGIGTSLFFPLRLVVQIFFLLSAADRAASMLIKGVPSRSEVPQHVAFLAAFNAPRPRAQAARKQGMGQASKAKRKTSEELKQLSRTPTHPQDRASPLVDHLLVLLGRGRKAVLERRVLAEDDLLWVVVSRWEIADSKKG